MHQSNNDTTQRHGTLATLRALTPNRRLPFTEALRVAELHANRLLELSGCRDQPDAIADVISQLPRIRIKYRDLPTSGLSYWDGHDWMIGINRSEPPTRQRFTLLHEYKHIIDHGHTSQLYGDQRRQAEQAAAYFAGCALMPKRLIKRAWGNGIQAVEDLAQTFEVSQPAIRVRLTQLGLADPNERCAPIIHVNRTLPPRNRYFRQLPAGHQTQECAA